MLYSTDFTFFKVFEQGTNHCFFNDLNFYTGQTCHTLMGNNFSLSLSLAVSRFASLLCPFSPFFYPLFLSFFSLLFPFSRFFFSIFSFLISLFLFAFFSFLLSFFLFPFLWFSHPFFFFFHNKFLFSSYFYYNMWHLMWLLVALYVL